MARVVLPHRNSTALASLVRTSSASAWSNRSSPLTITWSGATIPGYVLFGGAASSNENRMAFACIEEARRGTLTIPEFMRCPPPRLIAATCSSRNTRLHPVHRTGVGSRLLPEFRPLERPGRRQRSGERADVRAALTGDDVLRHLLHHRRAKQEVRDHSCAVRCLVGISSTT